MQFSGVENFATTYNPSKPPWSLLADKPTHHHKREDGQATVMLA